jgi:glycosyltransferase involved in cell wall biosynthesis
VSVYKETKQGAGPTRNTGFNHSKGEYISFFDVDDVYFPDILNTFIKVLDNDKTICSVFGKHARNKTIDVAENTKKIVVKNPPEQGRLWFSHFSKLTGPPSFMHRTEVVKALGGFPESLRLGEDAAFHIMLGLNYKMAFIDCYSYYYNRHSDSTTSVNNRIESLAEKYFKHYTSFYIPEVYQRNNMTEIKDLLEKKTFGSIGRILFEEKSMRKRFEFLKEAEQKILPMKIPFFIKMILYSICLTRNKFIYKVVLTRSINFMI